jgi:hypothetical protein
MLVNQLGRDWSCGQAAASRAAIGPGPPRRGEECDEGLFSAQGANEGVDIPARQLSAKSRRAPHGACAQGRTVNRAAVLPASTLPETQLRPNTGLSRRSDRSAPFAGHPPEAVSVRYAPTLAAFCRPASPRGLSGPKDGPCAESAGLKGRPQSSRRRHCSRSGEHLPIHWLGFHLHDEIRAGRDKPQNVRRRVERIGMDQLRALGETVSGRSQERQ